MSRIHEFDNLSVDKKRNVVANFKWKRELGDIVYVVDDTIFGSCKDGCIITENFLILRKSFSEPEAIHFDRVNELSCSQKILQVNGRKVFEFNIPDEHELRAFFYTLNEELSAFDDEGAESVNAVENVGVSDTRLLGELKRYITELKKSANANNAKEIVCFTFLVSIVEAADNFERIFLEGKASSYLKIVKTFPRSRLASYTYAAAFIAFVLEDEARYSLDGAERYYQFPFFLINHIISETSKESARTISSIANKGAGFSKSEDFKACDNEFGNLLQHLRSDGECAGQYLAMLNSIILDECTPAQYASFSSVFDDAECIEYIDAQLQLFERNIRSALIDILEFYSNKNEAPPLFPNIGRPLKIFYALDESSIQPRNFLED